MNRWLTALKRQLGLIPSRTTLRRTRRTTAPRVESLEDRTVPASTLYVDNPSDFIVTADQGAPGLDAGDTVTWNPGAGSAHGGPVTGLIFSTNAFGTIQDAVNFASATDTVRVAGGTFSELVSLDESITLLGNQFGVDARTRVGAVETIVNGKVIDNTPNPSTRSTAFYITANNATVDGFTSQDQTDGNQFNAGIVMANNTSGVTVRNNIIKNNVIGIAAGSNGPSRIEFNLIEANNNPGPAGGAGIYSEFTNGLTIDSNEFRGHLVGNPMLFASTDSVNGTHFNLAVTNNYLHDNPNASGIYALSIRGGLFRGNTIDTGGGATAISLSGANIGIDVLNNDLRNNARGLRITDFGDLIPWGGLVANSDIEAHFNDFSGNSDFGAGIVDGGVGDPYTGTLDLTGNWWGTKTGPTSAANPGGGGTALANGFADTVFFKPWLVYSPDSNPAVAGVQLPGTATILAGNDVSQAENDFTLLQFAVALVQTGQTLNLSGDFDWAATNAAAAYTASTNTSATADIRGVKLPGGVDNVTITSALADAHIHGLGDFTDSLYNAFLFAADGPSVGNTNFIIEKLDIDDFENAVMFGWNGTGTFNGTRIRDNTITVGGDDGDISDLQNIAIYFAAGNNQQITGNTITFQANGTRAVGSGARSFGFQNNTTGGTLYDGLLIDGNTFQLGATSGTEVITGIWENGHNDVNTSDIAISHNRFLGRAGDDFDRGLMLTSQTTGLLIDANTFTDVDNVFFARNAAGGTEPGDRFTFTNNVLTRVGGADGIFLRNVTDDATPVTVTINWNINNTIDGKTGVRGLNELSTQATEDSRPLTAASNLNAVNAVGPIPDVWVNPNAAVSGRFTDFDGPDTGAGPAAFGFNAFSTIQGGVNGVDAGGTVHVTAATYAENVVVNRSMAIVGPNAGINPNTGVRGPEAIVVPAAVQTSVQGSTSGTVFRVGTLAGHIDVTIDGLLIDGHNAALTGGRVLNGVEVHTGAAIVSSTGSFDDETSGFNVTLLVRNNILQNLERYGVYVSGVSSGSTVLAGNDVSFNKIDNLPSGNTFGGDRGRAAAYGWNVYGSVTNNVMTRVNVGWQDDNHSLASTGAGTLVDGNEIHTYHRGIFHNLQYGTATTATISNNRIFAETVGASTTNFGIELSSIQSAVSANVTGNDVTGTVYGVLLWNNTSTGNVTVSGGTLTGNQIGVLATSNDPQFGGGAASRATISGVSIVNPVVAGISIDTTVAPAATTLGITGGTSVSGGPVGLLVTGANSLIAGNTLNDTAFVGQTGNYITLANGALDNVEINATAVTFDGLTGATASPAQNNAIENKIFHAVDDATLGFIRVKALNVFVPSGGRIQGGIDAAAPGDTVNVQAGTYVENVLVNKAVQLLGPNAGISGTGTRGAEAIVVTNGNQFSPPLTGTTDSVFRVTASGVTISGFTIDGDDPSVTGSPLFSGADANTFYAVRGVSSGNLSVLDNIIQNVFIGVRGDGNSNGNLISQNWFRDIGNFDFGYAVTLRSGYYADVTDNQMDRVWTGVHINTFSVPNVPNTWTLSGNNINSYAAGLWFNQSFSTATPLSITGNQFAPESGAVANNIGILVTNGPGAVGGTYTGNTITGQDYGVIVWGTSAPVTLGATNSIVNAQKAGVYVTNNVGFNPIGTTVLGLVGTPSTVVLDGITISTTNPAADGVWVRGDAGGGISTLTAQNDTSISGGDAGVLVQGPRAVATITSNDETITGNVIGIDVDGGSAAIDSNTITANGTGVRVTNGGILTSVTENFITNNTGDGILITLTAGSIAPIFNNDLSGNGGFGVNNESATLVDASGNWWGSNTPAGVLAEVNGPVDYTPWLTSGTEDGATGAAAGFQGDFSSLTVSAASPQSSGGRIQEGIDLATAGGTVNVVAGTYVENVLVDKALHLLGADTDAPGNGTDDVIVYPAIDGETIRPSVSVVVEISASDVEVAGLTIDGNNPNLTGANNSIEGDYGILATHPTDTLTGLSIHGNHVANLWSGGIVSDTYLAGFEIYNNTVTNVAGDPSAIAIFNFGGGGVPGTASIHDNVISGSPIGIAIQQSAGVQVEDNNITLVNDGIGILDSNPGTGAPPPAGALDEFINNTITGGDGTSFGLVVINQAMDVLVKDNHVTTPGLGLGAFGSFQDSTTTFDHNTVAAGDIGIQVTTDTLGLNGNQNVSAVITNGNDVSGAVTGILVTQVSGATATVQITGGNSVHDNATGIQLDGGTVTVSENSITGNTGDGVVIGADGVAGSIAINDLSGNGGFGLNNQSALLVDASANYWGSSTAAGVTAEINGLVDYTPWLNFGDLSTDPGFQPDFSSLHVDDDSPQSGTGDDRINEAILLLADGSLMGGARIVQIEGGTYNENLDATNKALTLVPGDGPASVTVNDFTLNSDDTVWIDIADYLPGSGYDQFVVNGTTTLDGATLVITDTLGNPVDPNAVFRILDNSGTPINGTFTIPGSTVGPDGITRVTLNGHAYAVSYDFGTAPGNGTDFALYFDTNAAPVISVPGTQVLGEDTTVVFSPANGNAITVSDSDAGTAPIQLRLRVSHGTLTLGSTMGLSFVFSDANGTGQGDGTADAVMTFRGSQAAITAALNGLTYTPNPNYSGSDTLELTANDLGNTGPEGPRTTFAAVGLVMVNTDNDPPVVPARSFTIPEDTAVTGTLTATDPEGDAVTFALAGGPANGTVTVAADGTFTYVPNGNFNGTDSFTYTASDGTNTSAAGTVTITVTAVNDAPQATGGSTTLNEGGSVVIDLRPLVSDVETSDANLVYNVPGTTANGGSLTPTATNGVFTYTPPTANFAGPDSFSFTVTDSGDPAGTPTNVLTSSPATFTITVNSVNDAPVAVADSYSVNEDTTLTVLAANGVLANDSDPNDTPSNNLSATLITNVQHGTLFFSTDGSFVYTPAANYNGPDSFTYQVRDDGGTANGGQNVGNTVTVTINVTAVNDAPVAQPQSVTTAEDTATPITLVATDIDGDTLTYIVVTPPAHGTLSGTGANLVYTPAADYNGPDSFTFKANDGTADSNVATVSITVTAVNDAPVAQPQSVTTAEDTATPITLTATDVDSGTLTFIVVTPPSHGTLSGTGANLTYTPDQDYTGPDSFTFKANDGSADSAPATVSITVTPVNDAPTISGAESNQAVNDNQAVAPFGDMTVGDVDSASLTTTVTIQQPANGTFTPASLAASGFVAQGGGVFTFTGSPAATTAALRQLVFQPTENQVAPGNTVTTNFTVAVTDGSLSATDNTTSVIALSVPGVATLPFADSFNRSNAPNLGGDWTTRTGNFAVVNNAASSTVGLSVATVTGVSEADVAVEADVALAARSGRFAALVARYQGSGDRDMYAAGILASTGGFQAVIYRNVNGRWARIAAKAVTTGTGRIRFEVVGSSLKLFLNGTLATYVTDTTIGGPGAVGIRAAGPTGTTFDNFSADRLTPLVASLPFSTDFAPTPRAQLDRNWIEPAGNFAVNGTAASQAALSLAVLNGVSAGNVAVEADVALAAGSGRFASLVARYQGAGDYYTAGLAASPNGFRAVIYRNINGALTLISSQAMTTGTGRIRFEVVGSTLRLFLNGTLILTGTDTTIAGPGSVGIRAAGPAGTTFDNFSAA